MRATARIGSSPRKYWIKRINRLLLECKKPKFRARRLQAAMAIRKQQHRIAVYRPEAAQQIPCGARWLDQVNRHPGFFQHVLVEELEAIQVEFDGTPGVGAEQVGEVGEQLRLGQVMELMVKIVTDSADGACIGLDGFGLKAFQCKVLQAGGSGNRA